MAAVGSYSPFKLSEGSRHDQRDRIKLKKAAVRKHWKWWGKTHLHVTCEHGMVVTGSYLPCQLRAGKLHHEWKNLIEKVCSEKTWGNMKMREKLTAVAFCRRVWGGDSSDRPLLPVLTDGRWQAWLD